LWHVAWLAGRWATRAAFALGLRSTLPPTDRLPHTAPSPTPLAMERVSPAARGAPRMTAHRDSEGDDARLHRQNTMEWDGTAAPGAPRARNMHMRSAGYRILVMLQLHDIRHHVHDLMELFNLDSQARRDTGIRIQAMSDNMDTFLGLLITRHHDLMLELRRVRDRNADMQVILRDGRVPVPGTPPSDRTAFTPAAPGAPEAIDARPPSAGTGETPDVPDLPDVTTPPPAARGAPFTTQSPTAPFAIQPPAAHGAPHDVQRHYTMAVMELDDVYSHVLQVLSSSFVDPSRVRSVRNRMDRVRLDVFETIAHLFQVLAERTHELRLANNYNLELQRHVPGWRPPPLVPCTGETPYMPDATPPPTAALGAPPAVGTGWRRNAKRRRPSAGGIWWAVARRRVRVQHERMRRWLATPFGVDEVDVGDIENITDTEQRMA
jgi:hypothetical protein